MTFSLQLNIAASWASHYITLYKNKGGSNYLCIKSGLLHGAETANKSHRWNTDTLPVYGSKIQT